MSRGTSLVEVLVVIVILLVGILAVIQIFPKGLGILATTRNNAMASALARQEVERLQANPESLPEQILPVSVTADAGGSWLIPAANYNPALLTAGIAAITANGVVRDLGLGQDLDDWQLMVGANRMRRVVGEMSRIGAPTQVAPGLFGCLIRAQFGPIDYVNRQFPFLSLAGDPLLAVPGIPDGPVSPTEFFLDLPRTQGAVVYLSADASLERLYRVSISGYVNTTGGVRFRQVVEQQIAVPPSVNGFQVVALEPYLANTSVGETLASVEEAGVQVTREFRSLAAADVFSADPFEAKMLDARIGVFLVNPAAYNFVQERRDGRRMPLRTRLSYDVYDWRILREDFRVVDTDTPRYQLALQSLKVGGNAGPDGRILPGIEMLGVSAVTSHERADHFLLIDLATGGLVFEKDGAGNPLVRVDKSNGVVSFVDVDSGVVGTQVQVLLPDGITTRTVDIANRAMRALYMGRNEWAVQVLKAAASYREGAVPGTAQFQRGDGITGQPTRLYFAGSDLNRKVTIGEINYRRAGDTAPRTIASQDFVVRNSPADPLGPYVDITDVDPLAVSFDNAYGPAVRSVKGASVAVRVLWNPASFSLTNDMAENARRLEVWARNYRRSTTETFLQRGDSAR